MEYVDLINARLRVAKTHITQELWREVAPGSPVAERWTSQERTLPVTLMSWREAVEWVDLFNQMQSGTVWRLPTRDEVRVIAMAGRQAMPTSEEDLRLEAIAWEISGGAMQPVGTRRPSPAGLYDVIGNCWTWCSDYRQITEWGRLFQQGGIGGGSFWYSARALRQVLVQWMYADIRGDDISIRLVASI